MRPAAESARVRPGPPDAGGLGEADGHGRGAGKAANNVLAGVINVPTRFQFAAGMTTPDGRRALQVRHQCVADPGRGDGHPRARRWLELFQRLGRRGRRAHLHRGQLLRHDHSSHRDHRLHHDRLRPCGHQRRGSEWVWHRNGPMTLQKLGGLHSRLEPEFDRARGHAERPGRLS